MTPTRTSRPSTPRASTGPPLSPTQLIDGEGPARKPPACTCVSTSVPWRRWPEGALASFVSPKPTTRTDWPGSSGAFPGWGSRQRGFVHRFRQAQQRRVEALARPLVARVPHRLGDPDEAALGVRLRQQPRPEEKLVGPVRAEDLQAVRRRQHHVRGDQRPRAQQRERLSRAARPPRQQRHHRRVIRASLPSDRWSRSDCQGARRGRRRGQALNIHSVSHRQMGAAARTLTPAPPKGRGRLQPGFIRYPHPVLSRGERGSWGAAGQGAYCAARSWLACPASVAVCLWSIPASPGDAICSRSPLRLLLFPLASATARSSSSRSTSRVINSVMRTSFPCFHSAVCGFSGSMDRSAAAAGWPPRAPAARPRDRWAPPSPRAPPRTPPALRPGLHRCGRLRARGGRSGHGRGPSARGHRHGRRRPGRSSGLGPGEQGSATPARPPTAGPHRGEKETGPVVHRSSIVSQMSPKSARRAAPTGAASSRPVLLHAQ